jgi:hypothetical protein
MSNHQATTPIQRGPVLRHDDLDACASCGREHNLIRTARYANIPFCRDCLDRSLALSEWDDLGESSLG